MPDDPNPNPGDAEPRAVVVTIPDKPADRASVEPVPTRDGKKTTTPPDGPRARWRQNGNPDDDRLSPEIRKVIKAEQWKRHEAERHVDQLLGRVRQLEAQRNALNTLADNATLAEAKAKLEAAKEVKRKALLDGDVDAQINADVDIAKWAPEVHRMEAAVASRATTDDPNNRDRQPRQTDAPPADRRSEMHPKAKAWIEANPWFDADPDRQRAAITMSDLIVAEGFELNSDEYFEELNDRLVAARIKDGDNDGADRRRTEDQDAGADGGGRQNGGTATPPTRGSMGKEPAGSGTQVPLSAADLEHARAQRMTEERFALGRLRAQGKLTAAQHAEALRKIKERGDYRR